MPACVPAGPAFVPAGPGEVPSPAPVAAEERAPAAVPVDSSAPAADAAPLSAPELEELLLSVVARLTGYPTEMLNVDMELEADLGVDSIKRVEILSAVRQRVGDVATGDIGQLGRLRTLREIVEALTAAGRTPGAPAPDSPAVTGPRAVPKIPAMRTGSGSGQETALTRLVQRAVESPASGLATAGLLDGPLVVAGGGADGDAITALVARKLAEHGVGATAVAEVPEDARGVVHLGGLTGGSTPDDAREVHRSVFRAARAVAAQAAERGGLFVTVQDTGGDFGLDGHAPDRAWLGGVAGLTRTVAKEWPGVSVKAVDCERGGRSDEEVAEAIVRELLEGGPDPEAGLRADGTRTTLRTVPAPVMPGSTRRITSESVIVATGGARGVTSAALLDLARTHRPRIVLLGRTAPAPEPAGLASAADEPALTRLLAERSTEGAENSSPARIAARAREILAAREVRATLAALEAAGSPSGTSRWTFATATPSPPHCATYVTRGGRSPASCTVREYWPTSGSPTRRTSRSSR